MATVTDGARLKKYVNARWGRDKRGVRGLSAAVGISADTIYKWFQGKSPPDVEQLSRLAKALGVRRFEIVAAMDGVGPIVPVDEELEALVEARVEAALERRFGRGRA
jgi:transcriptional regulator with XRE-family HTH domain